MKPEITVLMSVYNGGKYLAEAVESILAQSFKNFEFLIINDGSTDNSKKIIDAYNDPRIILVDNAKNIGLVSSLNLGLGLAKGEFIARMDSDDISLKDRLSLQIDYLKRNNNIGMCGTWVKTISNISRINKLPSDDEVIRYYMLFSCPFAHSSVMMRKNVLNNSNVRYNEKFSEAEDYELWQRLGKLTKLANVPSPLLLYRLHSLQKNIRGNKSLIKYSNEIRRLQLDYLFPGLDSESIDTHIAICNEYQILDEIELLKRLKWISKIYFMVIDFNNNEILIEMLNFLYYRQCYIATKSNIPSLTIYKKNSPFKNNSLSFKRKFKLFYSSMFAKQLSH